MLVPRMLTGPNKTQVVCAIYFKKPEQQYEGSILMTSQLPQRCSVPLDLSTCFYCTGQSLPPSLLPTAERASKLAPFGVIRQSLTTVTGLVTLLLVFYGPQF